MPAFESGLIIDGYRLVRVIGSGGFGDVWLCFSETLRQHLALKIIRHSAGGHVQRELSAVQIFKRFRVGNSARAIMPVEHVGMVKGHLYYTMPLADGTRKSPKHPNWQPKTLGSLIRARRGAPEWFSSEQIVAWLLPIVGAVEYINGSKFFHRDVKPDNVMFLNDRPMLSDISLLRDRGEQISAMGTPGYQAPSWYIETGGNPDMYGLALTLYVALTGNDPDTVGKAKNWWPPQGESSLSSAEKDAWSKLHRVVFQATNERAERFSSLEEMRCALSKITQFADEDCPPANGRRKIWYQVAGAGLILALIGSGFWFAQLPAKPTPAESERSSNLNSPTNAWKQYDECFSSLQSELESYREQWRKIEGPAAVALAELKNGGPKFGSPAAAKRELQLRIGNAESIRQKIEKSQQEFWEERLPNAYRAAVVADTSSTGWKNAAKREAESADLMADWNELVNAIRVGPANWLMSLDEQ